MHSRWPARQKYYDDIGYPGHINCSDNFNAALADYGVTGRPGWMAINFFFNTAIDEHGVMYADEPWSRPGDHVLLRALTDIVCVSSACPDDTTAANGWNPTDIHVRTYSGKETFQRAVAYRPTPDAEPKMTKQTGFHDNFSKHTRNFIEYNGYWLANCFADAGPIEEYHACRQDAVIMDLSPLRKFEITGPDAGQPHGLRPMGLEALDMVRIEAGLIFAGYDFSDQTDPFEAGIGFTCPLKSKTDDFITRDALIRRMPTQAQRSK